MFYRLFNADTAEMEQSKINVFHEDIFLCTEMLFPHIVSHGISSALDSSGNVFNYLIITAPVGRNTLIFSHVRIPKSFFKS